MTQLMHTFIAGIILQILHLIVWHIWLKNNPIYQKNIREWEDIFSK